MYYFTSDFHLGHFNIIRYCNRPFKSVEEMENTIIRNWNERVKEEDTVFFLGDFCLKKSKEAPEGRTFEWYRKRLQGNIIFIRGNHDGNNSTKTIIESVVIEHGGKRIFMTHNPKFAKVDFQWNLCGHTHGKYGKITRLDKKSVIIDISVENWDYRPVDINEINQAYSIWLKSGEKSCK